DASKIVERLAREGVPNYFGLQRFGTRGNNHLVAKKLIEDDHAGALGVMLEPAEDAPADDPVRVARDHYLAGELPEAIEALPRQMMTENRLLRSIARGCDASSAFRALPRKDVDFLFCAFQSAVFNRVLAGRLRNGTFDKLEKGDIAMRTDNGACFVVDDDAMGTIGERCSSFEVSPTGPLVGAKTLWPADGSPALAMETEALDAMGVSLEQFTEACARHGLSLPGARRPVRVRLGDPEIEGGADEHGAFIRVAFDLPAGAYATSVVREISKNMRVVSA
ncbi:tRNA pseudouridine(13) synthase TruD, partial [Planctomycetaceae bacterium AH-315-I19]|nr:tRNA pseudouridine(13) synthase TruD [Planctomycetaceae bacterium AH-315-I19]